MSRAFRYLFILATLFLSGCAGAAIEPRREAASRSAVVLSIDALEEHRIRRTLNPASVPAILSILDEGACASSAVPAFPSATAAGHAALWTGAYGNVNGIAANWQPRLPRDQHTLLEGVSGYFADGLRAEPIWITAARAGIAVAGQHVTQAPQVPGYPAVTSGAPNPLAERWAEAGALLAQPGTLVLNGYNRLLVRDGVITEQTSTPRIAAEWRGTDGLGSGVDPLEISWSMGGDSLHALLVGGAEYDRALVGPTRDVGRAVSVRLAPVDTTDPRQRALARHFSEPLHVTIQGAPVSLRFRLFSLASDASEFRLFHTSAPRVDGSDPTRAERYVRDIGGWVGNASLWLLREGEFGEPLSRGGDGTAEALYLETAELLTRQYMRGAEWLLAAVQPGLLLDYFPLGDEIDHEFYGMVDPGVPGHDPVLAERAQRVRERGWQLVDLRVAHLRSLAARQPDGALFISGDHGMRSAWRVFRPNVALMEAGLLQTHDRRQIHLPGTRALSPNGFWISVNGTDWKGGIVPPDGFEEVLAAAERALLAVHDETGSPIVTRLWRAVDHPGLGIGGPAGGDLYFDLATGYYMSHDLEGALWSETRPEGKHGYPSLSGDMHTVLCMVSPRSRPRGIGQVRTTDLAPTVAEWLGMPAPPDATGRSVLRELTGEGR